MTPPVEIETPRQWKLRWRLTPPVEKARVILVTQTGDPYNGICYME